jgi:hypothetical protein
MGRGDIPQIEVSRHSMASIWEINKALDFDFEDAGD